jgi:hypothetical protein
MLPEPPFRAGQRVRCCAGTLARYAGYDLSGRHGTVVSVWRRGRDPGSGWWDCFVAWDGVAPPMLFHHPADELEAAGA